jgi:protein SMG7
MQTSYAFISIYRQRLLALDRAPQATPRQQQHQQNGPRQSAHGPVEYRKLLQRFRQFLAEEAKFWEQLVVRLHRSFNLTQARPALVALGILNAADNRNGSTDIQDAPEPRGEAPTSTQANANRNQALFPPEEASPHVSQTATERSARLAILTKALVCLGDIARYRELYNEAGGRPKAGHEDTVPARKNPRKRGDPNVPQIPRSRNYDKAQQCYDQARLLVPQEGNPSHQLAILASYHKDLFGSLYHYYRALCVRQPYDTATDNLGTVFTKALEQWKSRTRKEKDAAAKDTAATPLSPRERVEAIKDNVLVLHALWRLRVDK